MLSSTKPFLFWFLLFLSCAVQASSAKQGTHTRQLAAGQNSPAAQIADVSWLAGNWQGEIWGGQFEELWSQPSAGSMMASFKFVQDNQVKFYELITIAEHNNSLVLRLKHFGPELKGWEAKEQSVQFKLVNLEPKVAYFEGYTFKQISPNLLHVYLLTGQQGQKQETLFKFNRVNK